MNRRTGIVVLILICAVLIAALLWNRKQASHRQQADEVNLDTYSNKWVETIASLEQQRQVNASLDNDLRKHQQDFTNLTNAFTRVSAALQESAAALRSARDDIARRDARIAALETQNRALDRRVADLGSALTNLTVQIEDMRRKLAASVWDKPFAEWDPTNPPTQE
jgi:septal ring factor EnvC (AmiA/AmiB activator)